jgi:hypothetical protein
MGRCSGKRAQRMLQFTVTDGCGAYDQRAVGYRIRDGRVFFRARQQFARSYRRPRFTKRQSVRIHNPEMGHSEVAHCAGCGSYVERVSRIDQHNPELIQCIVHNVAFYVTCGRPEQDGSRARLATSAVCGASNIQCYDRCPDWDEFTGCR